MAVPKFPRGADREAHLSSRCRTAVLLLAAALLTLSLWAAPASSATTASKALRFVVVKRSTTHAVVKRGSVRLVVRLSSSFASVHRVPRYRVIKRARTYWQLMPVVSVVAHGAKLDGRTDDTAAIARAMLAAASAAKGVYLPAGTCRVSSLTMPTGLAVFGAGMGRTWLKGHLAFGSNELISDLKIGDAGQSAVHNKASASGTVFRRVHFRGGGGAGWDAPVIMLGGGGSCSNITFKDCEVERNVGIEDSSFNGGYNDITIDEFTNNHVSDITFDGCHVGVTNGVATGSPRMGLECWAAHGSGIGWHNITVRGCVFEATAIHQLDFSCYGDSGQATGVMVEGCTFHGGGVDMKGTLWGYAICLEWPFDVTIRNNHFHRCHEAAIFDNNYGQSHDTRWRITGNTFDWDTTGGGITARRGIVVISGANNIITGNRFDWHGAFSGWATNGCVELGGANATGNTVTGNTFHVSQTQAVSNQWGGATGNTTSPNTVTRQ